MTETKTVKESTIVEEATGSKKKEHKLKLQKLTPTNCEDMSVYNEALDMVFKEEDLLNIAISGPYSAGKSSVMKTYKENNKKDFINISLAHFEEALEYEDSYPEKEDKKEGTKNQDEKIPKNKKVNELDLEGKIINQLIHQVASEKIEQTRFKVKTKVDRETIKTHTTNLAILTILLVMMLFFDEWVFLVNGLPENLRDVLVFTTNGVAFIFYFIGAISIFVIYLYQLIKSQLHNPLLKKIKIQNNEIEIFDKDEKSYFDKYLDEILYIFQNANVDAIVFEDMDRYNSNVIFGKLREMNFLINEKSKDKPLRFFYLIKDDMFTSKDRTKFFDVIIPIVPVISSSNSYDKMIEFFEEAGIMDNFEKSFLQDLSLYIDDMRILKNINNEYQIYYGRIEKTETELNRNKLLAIVTYKNIFPKDFSDLILNSGYVYKLFENKKFHIEKRKNEIKRLLFENQELLLAIKNEHLENIDELDSLYLKSGEKYLGINKKSEDNFSSRLEFVKYLKAHKDNSAIYVSNPPYTGQIIDFQKKLDELSENKEYQERKRLLDIKNSNKVNDIQREIDKHQKDLNQIDSTKLKDIITRENVDKIFLDDEDEDSPYNQIIYSAYVNLIKYLIRKGHIDETYPDYITYFYENSLSRIDKIFLRSITDQNAKSYNYELKNVDIVISRLRDSDFEQEEVLNFHLLDGLLGKYWHPHLNLMLNLIKKQQRLEFVWAYLNHTSTKSNKQSFVRGLNNVWKEVWTTILSNGDKDKKDEKMYLLETFYSTRNDVILEMNIENTITDYISSDDDFLEIGEPRIDHLIDVFKSLEVRFRSINYEKANRELFNAVYKKNLYEINFKMLSIIIEYVYDIPKSIDYQNKNYTLLLSKPEEPLYKYVNKNIDTYMEQMLENTATEIVDSEKAVLELLNKAKLVNEYKKLYIQKLSTKVSLLKDIEVNTDMWEELLNNRVVKYTNTNVLTYYFKYAGAFDETLVNFIEGDPQNISFTFNEIRDEYNEKDASSFFKEVVKNVELSNEKYKMILDNFGLVFNEFGDSTIEESKFNILIDLGTVTMTKENLVFVRENYEDTIIKFIVKNYKKYINCIDEQELVLEDEILEILKVECIPDDFKIKMIDKLKSNISVQHTKFSMRIQSHILDYKFDVDDLEFLTSHYDNYTSRMKSRIKEHCLNNIDEVCNKEYLVQLDLLEELLEESEVHQEDKELLLLNSLGNVDQIKKVKVLLEKIGLHYFAGLFEGKRPNNILINEVNEGYLEFFKKKGWITQYKENESGNYQAFGRKTSKKKVN
jgi:hypothetical protein